MPEALSEHWSSRANAIEAEARARGVGGGEAKAYVALETRRAKDELRPLVEVKEEWRETARQHGFTERHVAQILRERRPALTPDAGGQIIDAAVENAVKQPHESADPLHEERPPPGRLRGHGHGGYRPARNSRAD